MKAKVLKMFRDKETGQVRQIGEIFDVSETRSKEILSAGDYIELVKPAKKKDTTN